jgi:AcrR family transcriptional regulator
VTNVKGSRRQASARETRRAVLGGAAELFVERGFTATTIDEVAARAGVSRPTVFAVGSKAELLRLARDVTMAGDDEQLAVSQRESAQRVLSEPDPRSCVELLALHVTGVQERYGPLDEVLRQAAGVDAELADLWRASEAQRRQGAMLFVDALASKTGLRHQREDAIDVLWLLMAPDQHQRLVRGRGWSRRRYLRWLTETITDLLLTPPA